MTTRTQRRPSRRSSSDEHRRPCETRNGQRRPAGTARLREVVSLADATAASGARPPQCPDRGQRRPTTLQARAASAGCRWSWSTAGVWTDAPRGQSPEESRLGRPRLTSRGDVRHTSVQKARSPAASHMPTATAATRCAAVVDHAVRSPRAAARRAIPTRTDVLRLRLVVMRPSRRPGQRRCGLRRASHRVTMRARQRQQGDVHEGLAADQEQVYPADGSRLARSVGPTAHMTNARSPVRVAHAAASLQRSRARRAAQQDDEREREGAQRVRHAARAPSIPLSRPPAGAQHSQATWQGGSGCATGEGTWGEVTLPSGWSPGRPRPRCPVRLKSVSSSPAA